MREMVVWYERRWEEVNQKLFELKNGVTTFRQAGELESLQVSLVGIESYQLIYRTAWVYRIYPRYVTWSDWLAQWRVCASSSCLSAQLCVCVSMLLCASNYQKCIASHPYHLYQGRTSCWLYLSPLCRARRRAGPLSLSPAPLEYALIC